MHPDDDRKLLLRSVAIITGGMAAGVFIALLIGLAFFEMGIWEWINE